MTFSGEVYVFAFIVLVFAGLFWWVSGRETGFTKFLLVLIAFTFFVLSLFGVLVGLAFSVEYSATADCENVINSTELNDTSNLTTYTYVDSCAGTVVPKSLSMLYVVYNYLLLFLVMVSVFSLMFIGLSKVVLKW